MKKLVIAAAAVAMIGGAFAACQEDTDCVFAFRLKLSGKSTVAFATKGNASACIEGACYRKAASFKVDGYLYGTTTATAADPDQCIDASCGCFDDQTELNQLLWNTKSKKEFEGDFAWTQLNLIGKDGKKLEAVATLGDLTLAGFGSYDVKKGAIKSISGNFAGQVPAPQCETCVTVDCETTCEGTNSIVFDLCSLEENATVVTTAAYGKWTLKPNKSAVKKLTKTYPADVEQAAALLGPKGFLPAAM